MSEITDINSYDYDLPSELIASAPTLPRENARLLVYNRASGEISHKHFYDLNEILPDCDIVFNDTKVVKARIFGAKDSGGRVELLLNQPLGENKFSVYIRGSVKIGTRLNFDKGLNAKVIELFDDGLRVVEFFVGESALCGTEIYDIFDEIGHVPLPPYIKRADNSDDESWYQTVFAKQKGAVAAPTASLHFSDELLRSLAKKHKIHYITLHVGAGTFKSVESSDIKEHKMHSEIYTIPDETAQILQSKRKILGVGTTTARTIEHFVRTGQKSGKSDIFINLLNPPKRLDYLITNFHLPKSTLIILVSAFVGLDETKRIYQCAIKNRYKFYSYGDGMLIL